MIDYQTIFSDKQVIEGTTLSNRMVDLQSLADYAIGRDLYAQIVAQGTHAHDLRVQILGSDSESFADAVVIGDSGVVPVADINEKKLFFVRFNPTGKKYRYVCLRFIPTLEGVESAESAIVIGSDEVPPVPEVGVEPTDLANAVKAFIAFVPAIDVVYPVAREGNGYTA